MKAVATVLVFLMLAVCVMADDVGEWTGRNWANWGMGIKVSWISGFLTAFHAIHDVSMDHGADAVTAGAAFEIAENTGELIEKIDAFYAEDSARERYSIAAVILVVTGKFEEWEKQKKSP